MSPWSSRRRNGCASVQNADGGWGETVGSYDDPNLRGQGDSTASQTAWAIMGLLAVGDTRSECVARGMAYLLRTQKKDGSWDEAFFTGTGFPRVFYLKYHLYRAVFPADRADDVFEGDGGEELAVSPQLSVISSSHLA